MKLIIMGGEGLGLTVAAIVQDINKESKSIELLGFLNDNIAKGETIDGYPVIGSCENAVDMIDLTDVYFFQALVGMRDRRERIKKIQFLNLPINKYAIIKHPAAFIARDATIGYGSVIMPSAVVDSGVVIGCHCRIYYNSTIAHNAIIDNFVSVGMNAVVGSRSQIESGAHLGTHSCIRENVIIGEHSIVGMGAVVTKSTPPNTVVYGNPASIHA